MKKNAPTMREVLAAEEALKKKIKELCAKVFGEQPSYEEERAWQEKHPGPIERHRRAVRKLERTMSVKADEIILAGRMGQITSEEFYSKVKNF